MNRAADSREGRDPATPEQIRNVVLVGPGGAGKTALFDRLVAALPRIAREQRGD